MPTYIERERAKVKQQVDAIRHLEASSFRRGTSLLLGDEPMPLLISAGCDPKNPARHFVSLGVRGNAPAIAQRLACGVLAVSGELVAVRRTDLNGQFAVDLDEGECTFRFVVEVRDRIDVDVLVALGDEAAVDQLEAAVLVPKLPSDVCEYIRQKLNDLEPVEVAKKMGQLEVRQDQDLATGAEGLKEETSAEPRTHQPLEMREFSHLASAASGHVGPERHSTNTEAFEGWQVDEQAWRIRFRFPADQAEFPYSAVLVKLVRGEQVVGTARLMPLALEPAGTHYANSIGLEELLGDNAFERTMHPCFWADEETIRSEVSLEEVNELLATPYVCNREQVAEALRRLRDDLQD